MLATSGGRTATGPAAHPVFFDGFLGHPEQAAAALLAVAKVARTRFYTPPGMVAAILRAADPVVTSNGDRLRFESFSACCGVYARYDALPGSLDGTRARHRHHQRRLQPADARRPRPRRRPRTAAPAGRRGRRGPHPRHAR